MHLLPLLRAVKPTPVLAATLAIGVVALLWLIIGYGYQLELRSPGGYLIVAPARVD